MHISGTYFHEDHLSLLARLEPQEKLDPDIADSPCFGQYDLTLNERVFIQKMDRQDILEWVSKSDNLADAIIFVDFWLAGHPDELDENPQMFHPFVEQINAEYTFREESCVDCLPNLLVILSLYKQDQMPILTEALVMQE